MLFFPETGSRCSNLGRFLHPSKLTNDVDHGLSSIALDGSAALETSAAGAETDAEATESDEGTPTSVLHFRAASNESTSIPVAGL